MNGKSRLVPWIVGSLFAVYLFVAMMPQSRSDHFQLQEFGKTPVLDGGRIKPIDTVARNSLMIISNHQDFKDTAGETQPAIKWLLDVMAYGNREGENPAYQYKVFRIENLQLLDLLGLPRRPGSYRYAIDEFAKKIDVFERQAQRVKKITEKKRDVFETKVMELKQHLELYMGIASLALPETIPPSADGSAWKSVYEINETASQTAAIRVREEAERTGQKLESMDKAAKEKLIAAFYAEIEKARGELYAVFPAARSFSEMLGAYRNGDAEAFNKELAEYQKFGDQLPSSQLSRIHFEAFFNGFEPFYHCSILYVFVFLLAVAGLWTSVGWNAGAQPLNKAALWLALLTLLLHTWALGARMWLQGRPPVTNLYSSAVWISWGCVVVGLVLESIYRVGIGSIVASVLGFVSMLLAIHLAGGGDTLEMMRAVLDDNFWLATHVTVVTFGYVATLVAGFLGVLYVFLGVVTPALDRHLSKVLSQMIYAVVCFATLLSFTGTVLGGIWADQSWGRFWGWDPKENGALIIVIWNALILHARWGGLVKQRGMAVLAIVGIMVTGWSWIGTNQLGVGLHAYGFNNTLAVVLVAGWAVCLLLVGIGMLPLRLWASFSAQNRT